MSKSIISDVKRWIKNEKNLDNRVITKRFDIFDCSPNDFKEVIHYLHEQFGCKDRVVLKTDFRDESLEIKILAKEEE